MNQGANGLGADQNLIANGKVVVGLRPRGRPPVKERGPIVVQEVLIPESCVA